MNVLSLFDGMSCGMIALERAGIKVGRYFASEIDKHAIKVSEKNYPNIVRLGDVRNIDLKSLPEIDILIGGSPCQSFSFAGKMKGMSTKENIEIVSLKQYLKLKKEGFEFEGQSYLFWEYVRVLKETKPKYFLLENVKMLKKWRDIISEALGVEPILINSALVSAQNRNRLYWTNIPNVKQPEDKGISLSQIISEGYVVDREKSHCCRTGGGLSGNSNKKRYFSKSFGQYKFDDYEIMSNEKNNVLDLNKMHPFSMLEMERLQTLPENYTEGVSNNQRYRMIGNGWTVDVISHIFSYLPEEYKLQ
jgi:DNA (cytosine-5)-methyltransferase 3A